MIKQLYRMLTETAKQAKFRKARESKELRKYIEDDRKRNAVNHYLN